MGSDLTPTTTIPVAGNPGYTVFVGRVVRIRFDNSRVSQIVTVEPAAMWRSTEEVVIIKRQDNDLARIIEAAGEDWIENAVRAKGQ